jgi:hypothetical protein
MKNATLIILTVAAFLSCNTPVQPAVNGTWKLFASSMIKGNDTTVTYPVSGEESEMIKVLNGDHFAFFKHDLKHGKDAARVIFDSGAGRYTLKGDVYTEFLDYCNYRDWEDKTFTFNLQIKQDTLIQRGVEKIEGLNINQEIIEMYVRVR